MREDLSPPARAVLRILVNAHNAEPGGRFTLAHAISRRGVLRVSHPRCNISISTDVFAELLRARLIAVVAVEFGYQVIEVTLRGFDYDAHMEQPDV